MGETTGGIETAAGQGGGGGSGAGAGVAVAAPEVQWSVVAQRALRWMARFGVQMVVAWVLSHVAQSFTESALWMPREWRYGVEFLVSFSAVTLTELVRSYARYLLPVGKTFRNGTGGASALSVAVARRNGMVRKVLALAFLAVAGMALWQSYDLRLRCVRPLTVTAAWWDRQFGPKPPVVNPPEVNPDKAGREGDAAGTGGGASGAEHREHQDVGAAAKEGGMTAKEHGMVDAEHGSDKREGEGEDWVPDFLNRERNTIYIPMEFDSRMGEYLRMMGDGDMEAGIFEVLDRQPMYMVDWLERSGGSYLKRTTMHFLGWHLLLMYSIAIAWGLSPLKLPELLLESSPSR